MKLRQTDRHITALYERLSRDDDQEGESNSKVIRQLNDELKAKGFITIAGRINREYFYERLYHNGKVVI